MQLFFLPLFTIWKNCLQRLKSAFFAWLIFPFPFGNSFIFSWCLIYSFFFQHTECEIAFPLITFICTGCFCYCTYFSIFFLCKKLLFFNYFSLFIHILLQRIVPIFISSFTVSGLRAGFNRFPSTLSQFRPHRPSFTSCPPSSHTASALPSLDPKNHAAHPHSIRIFF